MVVLTLILFLKTSTNTFCIGCNQINHRLNYGQVVKDAGMNHSVVEEYAVCGTVFEKYFVK